MMLRRSHARPTLLRRWLAVALTAAASAALCSVPAQGEPLAKLDANPASGGPIVVDVLRGPR
jgi:hypothetical protein